MSYIRVKIDEDGDMGIFPPENNSVRKRQLGYCRKGIIGNRGGPGWIYVIYGPGYEHKQDSHKDPSGILLAAQRHWDELFRERGGHESRES